MSTRRDFIKNTVFATTGTLCINSVLGCVNQEQLSNNINEIYKGFQNPPIDSRLFVRWWWNGNRLAQNEILRELDVMKNAGIGGVEINPIAFPGDTDKVGYEALKIFDSEWLEMLETAITGARERGMVCDMIVGSGWPFGGEFLNKEDQSQMVTIETIDLDGGKNYQYNIEDLLKKVDPHLHSKNKTVYKDLVMARLLPKKAKEFIDGIDLTEKINQGSLNIEVPEGAHVLYYVVKLTGYMAVINGAPGAAGPVLNHYSKEATERYLDRISGFITGKVGDMGNYIRAMFCDSMELEGANWNDDLPIEFEKRRGYSLLPYLPFVLKKVGHMGNPLNEEYGTDFSSDTAELIKRVDLDFYQTRIELFKERFIDTFNDWCHKNNVKSRMQAYGRGMHPLEASMHIDIPESETWLFKDVGREYPDTGLSGRAPRMCNKYVSSAAVLAGKKVVSCEEITNTSMAFMATLENIKVAGDQSNISGVNHSILHGFNYSPPEAKFPGWIRYGAYFNERNTWWPYFKNWSDYKARLSYIFQNAIPQANVAILQPLTDLWLKHGPQRDPFPQKWYPEYQNNIWEAINANGGGCDYVSEKIINESTFDSGKMHYNGRTYSAILLPEIETLDLKTVQSLVTFAKNGGKIIFIDKVPVESPSYKNFEAENTRINELISDLLQNKKEIVIKYPAPKGDVIKWYGKLQEELEIEPYVKFNSTNKYLSQSSYLAGENPVFFIANTSLSEHISVKAEFKVKENFHPWIWNPETGERKQYITHGNKNAIELELPRATSALIVFEKESGGEEFRLLKFNEAGNEITGAWQLQLNHINGETNQITIDSLVDLTELEQTKHFAGEVIYEKNINIGSDTNYTHINLGDVQGVSEIIVNNQSLGSKWYGAHIYELNGTIKSGSNLIKIKLTTITGNYLKGEKENKVAQNWTRHQEYFPMGVIGPVKIM